MHHWSLYLLRIAWPIEVCACIIFTMVSVFLRVANTWLEALPMLTILIAGQGVIAAAGPEVKRLLEKGKDELE